MYFFMFDYDFYCIINSHGHYYQGFYKTDNSTGYKLPATTTCLSEALKICFREEATKIVAALGKKTWSVKHCIL